MDLIKKNCSTCKFWDNYSNGKQVYGVELRDCLRYPPTAVTLKYSGQHEPYSVSPKTNANKWCGEYKRKIIKEEKKPFINDESDSLCMVVTDKLQ